MVNKLFVIIIVSFSFSTYIIAQNEDNLWMMGYTSFITPDRPDPDSLMGGIFFDFNYNPMRIYRDGEQFMSFKEEMTSMCDSTGSLLFYSNGMFINNKDYEVMEGGDSIAYGEFWERFVDTIYPTTYDGLRIWQGALSLPYPGHTGQYIMLYEDYDIHRQLINHVYYAIIDMNNNNGMGRVLAKDIDLIVQKDSFDRVADWGRLTACRHANGRDWWIIVPNSIKDKMYIYLLDTHGLHHIGTKEFETYRISKNQLGQASFSPDGTHYALWGGHAILRAGNIRLYDFDRCTGELSNERSDTLLSIYGDGLCFSPNGEYLYASNDENLYQFDLNAEDVFESRLLITRWDSVWRDIYGFRLPLSWMALGQNDKIYIIPNNGSSPHIHRINKPDVRGEGCQVQQHILKLPTSVGTSATIPNYPNFRLGPVDGSECDTLGIDNIPVSKFAYEQDSVDYLSVEFTDLSYFEPEQWSWDFGDGSTGNEINPVHIFPQKGIYDVCLTVSNTNATDTYCRTLNIAMTDDIDITKKNKIVDIFPNPVDDILLITISDYLPEDAYVEFYTLEGKKVMRQKVRYGWNSVEVINLTAGIYVYRVVDQRVVLKSGKVVVE